MTGLTWSEQDCVDNLTGALTNLDGLIRCRPERAEAVRAAVLDGLDDDERALLRQLAADLNRG